MSYPSARNCVMMCSESTRALGQPKDTNPTRPTPPKAGGLGGRDRVAVAVTR